jgi:hypothetical protein
LLYFLALSKEIFFMDLDLGCVSQYKNCVRGKACGNTCINKDRACKPKPNAKANAVGDLLANPDNLEKGAESFDGLLADDFLPQNNSLTDKFPPIYTGPLERFTKTSFVGDEHDIETDIKSAKNPPIDPPPSVQNVNIFVDSGFSKSNIEGKDGLKLALASRDHVREYVKQAPEGTVLMNTPFSGDGFGDQRAKLYEKAGFSPPDKDEHMYSIVSEGKNIPITLDEIKALKEAGHTK